MGARRMIDQHLTQPSAAQSNVGQLPLHSINTGACREAQEPPPLRRDKRAWVEVEGRHEADESWQLLFKALGQGVPQSACRVCRVSLWPACWDGTRLLHPRMPWMSVCSLSGRSEISTRALGFIRITTVRSLAYRLTDLPWGCFSKQNTLDLGGSSS